MVALTNALERIMNWIREHQSEYAASFLPGLKSEEIQAVEKELGFKLPAEIDVRALQPLTNALQDDSALIRKEAQEALLKPIRVGNARSIFFKECVKHICSTIFISLKRS